MPQILATSAIILAIAVTVNCQLFNEIQPPVRGRSIPSKGRGDNGLLKAFTYDKLKLNERPGAKNIYLPPVPSTYLPPKSTPSTNGPTYLPPTRPPIYNYTYMLPMGTFPPPIYYNHTYSTTTHIPIDTPSPLPPFTSPRPIIPGYFYNKPELAFVSEDLKRSKKVQA